MERISFTGAYWPHSAWNMLSAYLPRPINWRGYSCSDEYIKDRNIRRVKRVLEYVAVEELIQAVAAVEEVRPGGLETLCRLLGWQGGTRLQALEEAYKRLKGE